MTLPVAGHEYVIITKALDNTFYVEKYTGKCEGAICGWYRLVIFRCCSC